MNFVSDEKESYSWTIKLATLEEKINALSKENEHLKGEIESYQKVIQLMANETSNKMFERPYQIKAMTMMSYFERNRNTEKHQLK